MTTQLVLIELAKRLWKRSATLAIMARALIGVTSQVWSPSRVLEVVTALAVSVIIPPAALAHPVWCQEVHAGKMIAVARNARPVLTRLRMGQFSFIAAPLKASPNNLRRENAAAMRDKLSRLVDHTMLAHFKGARLLVPVLASTPSYYVSGVPGWLRVTRPWTKRFIEQVAAAKRGFFGGRLRITGLTRTTAYQRALIATNGNAAPAHGRVASTHLTGASVDISKRELTVAEINWLRTLLGRLTTRGAVHAIEEFREPHFHVLVRRHYVPYARMLASPHLIGGC